MDPSGNIAAGYRSANDKGVKFQIEYLGEKMQEVLKQLESKPPNFNRNSAYNSNSKQNFQATPFNFNKDPNPRMEGGDRQFKLKDTTRKRFEDVMWFKQEISSVNAPNGGQPIYVRFGIGLNPNRNNVLDLLLPSKHR